MPAPLEVIDSGVIEGRMHIALGQALIECHQAGLIPDTLRFLRFPPTALVGRHQALEREVDLAYCQRHGIGLARRITGGGAIYLDPGQLGWELVIERARLGGSDLAGLAREICEAAAASLRKLGVEAAFRPRNDIEVGGRKIGGTGGFFDGGTLFFQGTVLMDLDPEVMVAALRVPRAKLVKRELDSAAQRVVTLQQLLGSGCPPLAQVQAALADSLAGRFGLAPVAAQLRPAVEELAADLHREEIGREEFVHEIEAPETLEGFLEGAHTSAGGTIRTYLRLEGPARNRVASILITGDFFVTPPRVVYDLESALRGSSTDHVDTALEGFFGGADIDSLSVTRDDFAASIHAALGR